MVLLLVVLLLAVSVLKVSLEVYIIFHRYQKEDFPMPNPYLPTHEYIPDGEPRVFGDRVYIYGSHDIAGSDKFCDYVLKCWSAPVSNPGNWVCHGDVFRVKATRDWPSDTDYTGDGTELYAPDVVEKDGKLYGLVYPDYEAVDTAGINSAELEVAMEDNRKELNSQVAAYEGLAKIILYPNEFEKTPKKSIKRYLYANLTV